MERRYPIHTLTLEAPMIDRDLLSSFLKCVVRKPCPLRPDVLNLCWATLTIVKLTCLFPKAVWRDTAGTNEHMNMKISVVAFAARSMDSSIYSHSISVCDMLCHFFGKSLSFRGRKLRRKCKNDLSTKSRILSLFCFFNGIPKLFPIHDP